MYEICAQNIIDKHLNKAVNACFDTPCEEISEGVFRINCENGNYIEISYMFFGSQPCDYFNITHYEQGDELYHYHHEVPLQWSETTEIDTICAALVAIIKGWRKDVKV